MNALPRGTFTKWAIISEDGLYRYLLKRDIHRDVNAATQNGVCTFIMLNPSTADATKDDPTIRKCFGFAKRWGCGRLLVVNLFAWRATQPRNIPYDLSARGPENEGFILDALSDARIVVCAWGALDRRLRDQADYAYEALRRHGGPFECLGETTRHGYPRHPLYVPYSTGRRPYDLS